MLLYLCEKPSQARDIGKILGATARRTGYLEGRECRVTWCIGHLLEMWMPDRYRPDWKYWRLETLPIIPDAWQLAVRPEVARQFAVIQGLLAGSERVVIATDADREGETIGREVLAQCGYRGPVSRLWLTALDDASIRKALAAMLPGERTEALYRAGMGRARADWLVGMNLSRAYTLLGQKIGYQGVLPVGRVQTPTLRLVVERDRLIENFKPVAFFDLEVVLAVARGRFRAKWVVDKKVSDDEGRCLDIQVAQGVLERIQGREGIIQKAETKRVQEPPPLPLELSTLQQEASRRWGMSAKKTLDVAQSLYETHKAVTYPRTDCRYLPGSQWPEAPQVLAAMAASDPTLAGLVAAADSGLRSRAWDDKKITAHHAIIPTLARVPVAALSGDEMRLYEAIRRHYLAQFFPAFEYDRTVVDAVVERETFRATGRVARVSGWRQVLGEEPRGVDEEGEGEQNLPPVDKGEAARVLEAKLAEKRTKPPGRHTEGTLIQAMKSVGKNVDNPRFRKILRETAGIGTEATRASIIENLLARKLLAREGKKGLISTPPGRLLVDLLPNSVTDPVTTAVWEQALDDIAHDRGSLDEFIGKSVFWVSRLIDNVKVREQADLSRFAAALPVVEGGEGPGLACPQCGSGRLVARTAKRGRQEGHKFMGCNRFPQCRYIQSL